MSTDFKAIARDLVLGSPLSEDDIDDLVLFINEDMELAKCIAERLGNPRLLTAKFFTKALEIKKQANIGGRAVRFSEPQQIRITSWKTLSYQLLSISSTTKLRELLRTIRNTFDVADLPDGDFRVYALYPGALIDARCRIDTEEQFNSIKEVYINGNPKIAPPCLYVWPLDEHLPSFQPERTQI